MNMVATGNSVKKANGYKMYAYFLRHNEKEMSDSICGLLNSNK